MAQLKFVGISRIIFLLSVKYIRFMQRNAAPDLLPLQRSCFYPFSPLSSARRFCLYIASLPPRIDSFNNSLSGSAAEL